MHVGLKNKDVIFAIKWVISARYTKEDNKVQHKAIYREDLFQNRKPTDLGGKQVHKIENDNMYIIDSIEFSLDPDTGKLK